MNMDKLRDVLRNHLNSRSQENPLKMSQNTNTKSKHNKRKSVKVRPQGVVQMQKFKVNAKV